ncbi:MAG: hypothetical protein H8D92_00345 [Pelagibacteraceae bacterium]|nr:hypothetical protein [Pelagibacteraceae bacterium]
MEEIQEQVENLIEEIENDGTITTVEISEALYRLKEDIEEYLLSKEEGLQWEDLD